MSLGLKYQLQELDQALSSRSPNKKRLKQAMGVTTLSDMSWLVPDFARVVHQLDIKDNLSVLHPLMVHLPKVGRWVDGLHMTCRGRATTTHCRSIPARC
jgi:hypothetical protein